MKKFRITESSIKESNIIVNNISFGFDCISLIIGLILGLALGSKLKLKVRAEKKEDEKIDFPLDEDLDYQDIDQRLSTALPDHSNVGI